MRFPALFAGALSLGAVSASQAQAMRTFSVSRPGNAERALHVTLDFSGGTLLLGAAPAGELYSLQLRYDGERSSPIHRYDPRTGIVHLGLEPAPGGALRVSTTSAPTQTARITLAADIPMIVDVDVGASDATLDFGGTTLTQLAVHSSASHAVVDFSRPTSGYCRLATFTVGAAQLDVKHAAAAGCAEIRVDGGAGGATLSFDGAWRRNTVVDVDLSMGRLVLLVPRGTGVRFNGERFLAPFNRQGFVQDGKSWTTPDFGRSHQTIDVNLRTALVGIDVRWMP